MTSPHTIREFGDPVLKTRCGDVSNVDDTIRTLCADMLATMYEAPGVGLAAPQVGVQKRLFVYDDGNGEGGRVMINPTITETSGEQTDEEGCLSVPLLYFMVTRPDTVHIEGTDLDGNELKFVATGFSARVLQHEFDHLNGTLILDRLDPDQKKQAMRDLRERDIQGSR